MTRVTFINRTHPGGITTVTFVEQPQEPNRKMTTQPKTRSRRYRVVTAGLVMVLTIALVVVIVVNS